MGRRRADSAPGAAEATERLAVLLAAGLPPAAAWRHVARTAPGRQPFAAAAAAAERGDSVARALAEACAQSTVEGPWRTVAVAIELAERTGAPLAGALDMIARSLQDASHARREVEAALTGPQLSSRLVVALPAVGVLFGYGLGFDPVAALLAGPVGWTCLVVGLTLFGVGAFWSRRLVSRATGPEVMVGLDAELVAIVLGAGLPAATATALVAETARRAGVALLPSATLESDIALAQSAGAPVAGLLRAEAGRARRAATVEARSRAESLAITLLLPLGLCVLPAFMLLGVAPLLLAVISSTTL